MASLIWKSLAPATAISDAASCYFALLLLMSLILLSSLHENSAAELEPVVRGKFLGRPCDEIYVVGEGETLHTISEKCGDPFIVQENPHINDPDDVFPGLVIKITPLKPRQKL